MSFFGFFSLLEDAIEWKALISNILIHSENISCFVIFMYKIYIFVVSSDYAHAFFIASKYNIFINTMRRQKTGKKKQINSELNGILSMCVVFLMSASILWFCICIWMVFHFSMRIVLHRNSYFRWFSIKVSTSYQQRCTEETPDFCSIKSIFD